MKYVDVIIDNKSDKVDRKFTYCCDTDDIVVGQRVFLPFGRGGKNRTAYVVNVADKLKENIPGLKQVGQVDDFICLNEEMIQTAMWMKGRYGCRAIECINMFLPPGEKAIREVKVRKNLYPMAISDAKADIVLTEEQGKLIEIINKGLMEGFVRREEVDGNLAKTIPKYLIHGVTGSGKTQLYMEIVHGVLESRKTAIVLVPEISLTNQIVERFVERFGWERVAVIHSKLSKGERQREWLRLRRGEADVVIGVRSAVFAPLKNIGVVILDEEHETTYKSDRRPRYETVEVAIMRLQHYGGTLILGSATPSVVSYKRAEDGIYRLLKMEKRYNENPLPMVSLVDMRQEFRKGNKSILSIELREKMEKILEAGQQVIIFMNRRGYNTYISCQSCGEVIKCPHCNISLTYHNSKDRVICHYCGYGENPPRECSACGERDLMYSGMGTEQLEEIIGEAFPNKTTGRLDFDTTMGKTEGRDILEAFSKGKTDILVGTQMVSKGLDFSNVALVGIVAADISLNIPDFRSAERTFQLLTQSAGRSGRGESRGEVVVQTFTPENYAIVAAAEQDYEKFYREELRLRKALAYPPFSDFIQIILSSKEEDTVRVGAEEFYECIRGVLGEGSGVFSPISGETPIEKGIFKSYILIKVPSGCRTGYMKVLMDSKEYIEKKKSDYSIDVDVNPFNMWRN